MITEIVPIDQTPTLADVTEPGPWMTPEEHAASRKRPKQKKVEERILAFPRELTCI